MFFSFEYKTKIEFIPSECSGKATVNIDGDTKEIDLSQNQKWKIKRRDNIVNNISFHDFSVPSSTCRMKIKLYGKKQVELKGFKFKDINFSSELYFNFKRFVIFLATLSFFVFYLKNPLKSSHPHAAQRTQKRFYNLDFLRIIFMGQIVYTHLSLPLKFDFSIVGYTEYFFILSGFFIFLTFKPEKSVFGFICEKITRWWPLMIWGILIRLCVTNDLNVEIFISELLFLPLTGVAAVGINQPDWFLAALFWSSLFYLLLLKALDKNKFALALFFITTSSALVFAQGFYGIYNMQVIRGILGVGLGCCVAGLYLCIKDWLLQNKAKINPVLPTLLECFMIANIFFCKNWLLAIFSNAFLIFLFSLQKGYVSNFFNTKFFAYPGKYVLAVFLTHGFIVNELLPIFLKIYPQIAVYKITVMLVTYLAVVLFGIFSYNILGRKPDALKRLIFKGCATES